MINFFQHQMDYVYFFYGLAFIVLGSVCFVLRRTRTHDLPWLWLGIFGIVHGINEWADLLAISIGDNPNFYVFRLILMIISFLLLVEFGRRGTIALRGTGPGVWVYIPLLIMAMAGVFYGLSGVNASSRYSLGFVGSLWAARVLFNASVDREKNLSNSLRLAGAAIALYGLAAGIVVPENPFFPATLINNTFFLENFGVPIQLVRGVLAAISATAIWFYLQIYGTGDLDSYNRNIRIKDTFRTAIAVLSIVATGWIVTEIVGIDAEDSFRQNLLSRTVTAASAINPDFVYSLSGQPGDIIKYEYRQIRRQLMAICEITPDCKFIYLVGNKDGQIVYLVDSERFDSEHYSAPGKIYSDNSPYMHKTLEEGGAFVEGLFRERRGDWVSSYAAIVHPQTREVIALLVVDTDPESWFQKIAPYRLNSILVTLILAILTIVFSITLQRAKESAAQIAASESRFKAIFESAPEAIFIFDVDSGRILAANPFMSRWLGYTHKELLGLSFNDLVERGYEGVYENIGGDGRPGLVLVQELRYRKKSGVMVAVEVFGTNMRFHEQNCILAFVRDVTDRKKAEETINHMAYHDDLTGLPNRVLFNDRLNLAITRAKTSDYILAVMFIDLDHFKVVNDMLGHAVGDKLLKGAAQRLQKCMRPGDTAARMGGDEFTVLLPEIDRIEAAGEVAQNILKAFKEPWEFNGQEFHITTSIGIAVYPNDGEDAGSLLKNADTAMYRAKEYCNNYQLYTPSMNAKIIQRVAMENGLRRALERGEFLLYYQPKVNIKTGEITGIEALLRWQHPVKGLVSPQEFIAFAEETRLIIPIGEWVLKTACLQAKTWQDSGLPGVRVAVNISACQFQEKSFVNTIANVLQETGLHPRWLELEITESMAMQDAEYTINMLNELRSMGIEISIDDFGTGYSSLTYLQRFPINSLKIDRSFVRDIVLNRDNAAIISTVVVLAKNLNLKVIAEGVENEEQLKILQKSQCYEMQGYLFSMPLPAKELEGLLKGKTLKFGDKELGGLCL